MAQTLQATRGSLPGVQASERRSRAKNARARAHSRRLSPFLLVLTGWTALAHVPVAMASAMAASALGLPWPWAIGAALAVALVLPFHRRMLAMMPDRPRPRWQLALIEAPYFAHWCAASFALAWTTAAAMAWVVGRIALGHAPFGLNQAALWGYLTGALVAAWGVWVRRKWVRVRRLDVPVRGLDPVFHGYKIVQLSDLHLGSFNPEETALRWVRLANSLDADLIAVTGDLITSGEDYYASVQSVIRELRARDGVVVSPGNHDYFGDAEALFDHVRASGARLLRNEGFTLRRGGASLQVAGVDDTWTRRADVHAALAKRPDGAPTVLLAHDPDLFPIAAARGVQLVLSGHTHGGQIAVPFLARWINLSKLSHRYHLGLYRDGPSHLFVSGGLGTTGPPIRVGSAPEICVIRLVASHA
ncbi:MAG: metallophosphoesterase [Deltaproteobacteria bacterium]|nr:metallophosphoesterase [Deltaproteobacteria bacterium]